MIVAKVAALESVQTMNAAMITEAINGGQGQEVTLRAKYLFPGDTSTRIEVGPGWGWCFCDTEEEAAIVTRILDVAFNDRIYGPATHAYWVSGKWAGRMEVYDS